MCLLFYYSKFFTTIIRLLTREERIIQLPPLLQTEFSIGPSAGSSDAKMYDNSLTVLMANSLQALEPRKTFTLSHSISGKLTLCLPPKVSDVCSFIFIPQKVFNICTMKLSYCRLIAVAYNTQLVCVCICRVCLSVLVTIEYCSQTSYYSPGGWHRPGETERDSV